MPPSPSKDPLHALSIVNKNSHLTSFEKTLRLLLYVFIPSELIFGCSGALLCTIYRTLHGYDFLGILRFC